MRAALAGGIGAMAGMAGPAAGRRQFVLAEPVERQRLVGPEGIEVANAFAVALNPADLAELAKYQGGLESRLVRYLTTFADERGLVPVGPVTVALVADPTVRRRTVRVDAQMDDQAAGPETGPAPPIGSTEPLPRIQRPVATGPLPNNQAVMLVLEDGRQVPLTNGVLRIGRALDNDLVIADSRVSRYHAQIVRDGHGPIVRDLGSTNGTAVAGRVVAEDRISHGDTISLGGYQIGVQIGASAGPGRR
jgi:hypothetical protein